MSTLQDLWSNYWWVLPVALVALCVVGCILGGRRGYTGCCPCGTGAPRERRGQIPSD